MRRKTISMSLRWLNWKSEISFLDRKWLLLRWKMNKSRKSRSSIRKPNIRLKLQWKLLMFLVRKSLWLCKSLMNKCSSDHILTGELELSLLRTCSWELSTSTWQKSIWMSQGTLTCSLRTFSRNSFRLVICKLKLVGLCMVFPHHKTAKSKKSDALLWYLKSEIKTLWHSLLSHLTACT